MQVIEPPAAGGRHAQRSLCPVACSLDVLGDRWTLLVIRDLLHGKTRYGDFLASGEGIPTNILADRLKRLEEAGAVGGVRTSRHSRAKGYHLTEAGEPMRPRRPGVPASGSWNFPG